MTIIVHMKSNKSKKNSSDDTQVLQRHGVEDVIPKDGEYYTLDLRRGDDTDVNDRPDVDVVGNNPLDIDEEERLIETDKSSTSSNTGGIVRQKDIVSQNQERGVVAGEPGHWGVDEDT